MTDAPCRCFSSGAHVCCFSHFPLLCLFKGNYLTGEKVGYKYQFEQYAAGPPLVYISISYISARKDSQVHSLNQTTEDRQQTTEDRKQTTDNRQQTTDNRQKRTDKRQKTKNVGNIKQPSLEFYTFSLVISAPCNKLLSCRSMFS